MRVVVAVIRQLLIDGVGGAGPIALAGPITLHGRAVEAYGNKLVLQDANGRTLVNTGLGAERPVLIIGATATLRGRFDDGFVQASFLLDPARAVTQPAPQGRPLQGPPPQLPLGGDTPSMPRGNFSPPPPPPCNHRD